MQKLLKMFFTFLKIGSFTFGGGYAMIPLIEKEVVEVNQWLSKDEFLEILVIAQSFPGALAVNSSTFIGYKIGKFPGAILGLLGVTLPSFGIILIIAMFFSKFRNLAIVERMFSGINAAVPLLVLVAVVSLSKSVKKSTNNIMIVIITVILTAFLNVNPVIIIILAALYGIFCNRKKVS
ncbi:MULTISPECIES: chromate transporter [Clostridium]|uniref:Chromate transporter n=1 Tax=Clostridium senegalense TaxID=1465809 RepID=A0A6M0H762_9CLOT|nr:MULTISPECIES: chromate transporter [Clostridium]NEU05412.1 chromate transporter [Clostridium senegalense]